METKHILLTIALLLGIIVGSGFSFLYYRLDKRITNNFNGIQSVVNFINQAQQRQQ